MEEVIIVGGGLAGLSCATALRAAGRDPLVLEAAEEPGGKVRSERRGGFLLERGPHTFLGSAAPMFALARAAGLEDALLASRKAARRRLIARGGKVHPVPTSPLAFLRSGLLSVRGKLRLLAEPLCTARGQPDDSAATFFARRFGEEAARVLAGSFISGIYAGDPASLSARAAFPTLWSFERRSCGLLRGALRRRQRGPRPPRRRGLFSFREGMGQLTRALARRLGERYRTGVGVRDLGPAPGGFALEAGGRSFRCRQLVLAVPPPVAAELCAFDGALGEELRGIRMAPIAVVHLGYPQRLAEIPEAFGMLAARGEGVRSLGVLFPSRIFEGRAEGELLTAYVGGMLDPGAVDLPDDQLVALVRRELAALFQLSAEPSLLRVLRWRRAIPQLERGHVERVARLHAGLERWPGLRLAGNYLTGVGVKDAVAAGLAAARGLVGDS